MVSEKVLRFKMEEFGITSKDRPVTGQIDLKRLPPPKLFEEGLENIRDIGIKAFTESMKEEYSDFEMSANDPSALLLGKMAYMLSLERKKYNDQIRELLAAFAKGANLDHLLLSGKVFRQKTGETDEFGNPKFESDSAFLSRFLGSYDRFSTAGASPAYEFFAKEKGTPLNLFDVVALKAEDEELKGKTKLPFTIYLDAKAEEEEIETVKRELKEYFDSKNLTHKFFADEENKINVPLLFRDQEPTESLSEDDKKDFNERLLKIKEYLELEDIKPINDILDVFLTEVIDIPISATLYVPMGVDREIIKNEALKKLTNYKNDSFRIGASVTVSGLHAALTVPNVKNVELHNFDEDRNFSIKYAPRLIINPDDIKMELVGR